LADVVVMGFEDVASSLDVDELVGELVDELVDELEDELLEDEDSSSFDGLE
jgi:hypothetical protein